MFSGIKLAVFGDFMTDYWYDVPDVSLCPSFPALDLKNPIQASSNPGGAGNVSTQIAKLGASASLYVADCQERKHRKEYYMHQDRELFRISRHYDIVSPEDRIYAVEDLRADIGKYDGVIVCDYGKGMMSPDCIVSIMLLCQEFNIPVFVDPKFDNWELYKGAEIFKCNHKEYTANKTIRHNSGLYKHFVITKSSDGMAVCTQGSIMNGLVAIPGIGVPAVDPTGAGDSTMAAMTLEYLRTGGDILQACRVGNIAGSLVVRHPRIYNCTVEELKEEGAWDD